MRVRIGGLKEVIFMLGLSLVGFKEAPVYGGLKRCINLSGKFRNTVCREFHHLGIKSVGISRAARSGRARLLVSVNLNA
jgi:hypothetical protein